MKIEVLKGEFSENMPWRIETDYKMCGSDPCEHCAYTGINEFGEAVYSVRAVVIAENEGGYNQTIVCLDCILENSKQDLQ